MKNNFNQHNLVLIREEFGADEIKYLFVKGKLLKDGGGGFGIKVKRVGGVTLHGATHLALH